MAEGASILQARPVLSRRLQSAAGRAPVRPILLMLRAVALMPEPVLQEDHPVVFLHASRLLRQESFCLNVSQCIPEGRSTGAWLV